MKVKIWPRDKTERGGYACMPMKKNISIGHDEWKLTTCPECGRECWRLPEHEKLEKQGVICLCTECALKKGAAG